MENKFSIPGLFYIYRSLENLERFLSINKRPKLTIRIKRILIGCNVDRTKKSFLEKIIKALDSGIEIVKMHKDYLNYGYIY